MDYGEIIKSAFWISLRNRYLWFFGFFVGGTTSNFGGNIPTGGGGGGGFESTGLLVALIALAVLLLLVFLFFSVVSQGALARSVAALDRGESRGFVSTFRAGLSQFWRVLGYYVVFFLIFLGAVLVVVVPFALLFLGVFAATESIGTRVSFGVLMALAGILLLIAVLVLVSTIAQFALRRIVVDGEGILGSVRDGYELFRRNVGKSLLVVLISIGLAIGVGIAFFIVLLIVGLILFLPTIALALAGYSTAAIVAGVIAALILVPLLFVATGAIGTFNHAYWTLAYLRLAPRDATPAQQTIA